jgi:hypothetical protein
VVEGTGGVKKLIEIEMVLVGHCHISKIENMETRVRVAALFSSGGGFRRAPNAVKSGPAPLDEKSGRTHFLRGGTLRRQTP